jgi:branched-chain amino acid transport system ATP-binding protein
MASALELRHVSAGYGETVVIEDFDLALAEGESISVIGRNGVGKSTLLATVMGHTTLHEGEMRRLGGTRLDRLPVFRRSSCFPTCARACRTRATSSRAASRA